MKTYKLREFLQLPVGTIFYSFDHSNLCVKQESIIEKYDDYLDFYFIFLSDGTNRKKQRFGSPDLDDEFDVLEKEDLLLLKNYIHDALKSTITEIKKVNNSNVITLGGTLTPYGEIQNLRKILREYLKDYSLAYNYYDCSYEDDGSDLKFYLRYLDKEIKNNLKKLREQVEKFED